MKYIFVVLSVSLLFVAGKVFGAFHTSTTVDLVLALGLMVGWFMFIFVNVPKTPGAKGTSIEYSHQDHPYMLMV